MIYELNITLEDLPLPVTRTIQISSDMAFFDLHFTLISSFNWMDTNPHVFEVVHSEGDIVQDEVILPFFDIVDEDEMEDPESMEEMEKDPNSVYEDDVKIGDYLKEVGDTVLYKYDHPDFWKHVITLDQVIESPNELDIPVCVGAENDAPEEFTQSERHKFDKTLRNDDSVELVREINATIELAFDDEFWDEEEEEMIEGMVDDILSQVFGDLDGFFEDEEESKDT